MHVTYHIEGWPGVLMQVFLYGIVFAYLVIAWQFWHRRNGDPKARKALNQLVGIFVLCSFAGYVPRLFHFPDWALLVIHGALFACAWAYVSARQADTILDALLRSDRGDGHGPG